VIVWPGLQAMPFSEGFARAKHCMRMVDSDRIAWAQEIAAYRTFLASLQPLSCSPKNNVIIGVPTAASGEPQALPLPIDRFTPRELVPGLESNAAAGESEDASTTAHAILSISIALAPEEGRPRPGGPGLLGE
jgi:hypothetical protein